MPKKGLRDKIAKMEAELEEMKAKLDSEPEDRYWKLLLDLWKRGGIVSKEEFHEIAKDAGYNDLRALGGFHTGKFPV
ncbi:MAG: hypothetical protein ACFFCH_11950, partial [Promethearchaeota archaeon]